MSDEISGQFLADRQSRLGTLWRQVKNTGVDVAEGVAAAAPEIVPSVVSGLGQGVEEVAESFLDFTDWFARSGDVAMPLVIEMTEPQSSALRQELEGEFKSGGQMIPQISRDIDIMPDYQPDTIVGSGVKGAAQFVPGFAMGGWLTKAAGLLQGAGKVNAIARPMVAGAFSDAVAFDPDDPKISNHIQELAIEYPVLANPITEFLAVKDDDGKSEKRLKAALEGVVAGGMADGALRFIRGARNWWAAKSDIPPEAAKASLEESAEEVVNLLGDETAPLFRTVTVQRGTEGAADTVIREANAPPDLSGYPDYRAKPNTKLATGDGRFVETPEGKFVALEDGSLDLGRVDETVAEAAGISPAPIRLAEGNEKFGLKHIQNGHAKNIKKATGMEVDEFVLDVLNSFNVVKEGGKGRIIVSKQNGKAKVAILELERTGDHYTVITAGIRDKKALGKKKTLWSQTRKTDSQTSLDHIEDKAPNNILPQDNLEINLAALNTPEDIDRLLSEVTATIDPQIQKNRRGVRGNDVTREAADGLDMRVDELLKRRPGEAFNAEQALAARDILASSQRQLIERLKKANSVDATPLEQAALLRHLKVHSAIKAQIGGIRAEAGRALQQFRIDHKGELDVASQVKAVLENNEGRGVQKYAKELQRILQMNPYGFEKMVEDVLRPDGVDMLQERFINNVLMSPLTHMRNVGGNAAMVGVTIAERYAAASWRRLIGGEGTTFRDANHELWGAVMGMRDGIKLASRAFMTGESSDLYQKIDLGPRRALTAENLKHTLLGRGAAVAYDAMLRPVADAASSVTGGYVDANRVVAEWIPRAVDLLGSAGRVSGHMLMVEDELFRAINYRKALHRLSSERVQDEGLVGVEAIRRMKEIVNEPPRDVHQLAIEEARKNIFTQEPGRFMGGVIRGVRSNRASYLAAPFLRTVSNINSAAFLDRSPIGFLADEIRRDVAAGGGRKDFALARMGLATMTMTTIAQMVSEGKITGAGPTEAKERAAWLAAGNRPYSIVGGGKHYSYDKSFEPIGLLLGIAADYGELSTHRYGDESVEAELEDVAAALLISTAKNMTNSSPFSGTMQIMDAIEDPSGKKMVRVLGNMASGHIVPNIVPHVNRVYGDGVRREIFALKHNTQGDRSLDIAQSIMNSIHARIGSGDLPPRLNIWGEPLTYDESWGLDIVSPIKVSETKRDWVTDELSRLGDPIGMLGRTISGGITLTPREYNRYMELARKEPHPHNGQTLKKSLGLLMQRPEYVAANDELRLLVIRDRVNEYSDYARAALIRESRLGSLDAKRPEGMDDPTWQAIQTKHYRERLSVLVDRREAKKRSQLVGARE